MIALIDQYRSCLLELYYDLNIFMTIFELFSVSSKTMQFLKKTSRNEFFAVKFATFSSEIQML